MEIGADLGQISGILTALFAYGIVYNWFAAWAERTGFSEKYIPFVVAGGFVGPFVGYALMPGSDRRPDLLFLCYVASGIPVTVGYMLRKNRADMATHRRMIGEVSGD